MRWASGRAAAVDGAPFDLSKKVRAEFVRLFNHAAPDVTGRFNVRVPNHTGHGDPTTRS
jgi:hypothetical protein